jgi:hypothetical protein
MHDAVRQIGQPRQSSHQIGVERVADNLALCWDPAFHVHTELMNESEAPRRIISVRVLPRCCPRRTPSVLEA